MLVVPLQHAPGRGVSARSWPRHAGPRLPARATPTAQLLLTVALAACGGDGAPTATGPGDSTGATPPRRDFPAIRAALTVDPDALPAYASPAWPVHYDAAVRAREPFTTNPVSDAGATMGRALFFDARLSINRTVSCASCHAQALGFTDSARFSVGFDGVRRTALHSMRLANLRLQPEPGFFWDRRAASLEAQVIQPILDDREMGFTEAVGGVDSLMRRLRTVPLYPELATLAFGDADVTVDRMRRALAQYVRSLVSTGSRWDAGYAQVFAPQAPDRGVNVPVPGLTAEENRGRQLFMQPPPAGGAGCAGCHAPPTFLLAPGVRGNGLDAGETRVFKSPSLQNVAVRGPYMHDGRHATLEEVIRCYAREVRDGPALDQRLRAAGGGPLRLTLSPADERALVAFLRTLTDATMLADPKFATPFR